MGTKVKLSAVVLVAAILVYFVARTPQAESPPVAAVEPPAAGVELVGAAAADPTAEAVRRSPLSDERPRGVSVAGMHVLRVILEGITEENARMTTVTWKGVDERVSGIRESLPCQGRTSEFDLDPYFARVAERYEGLRVEDLSVHVDHPLHLLERIRVPLSRGVPRKGGQIVHEVRVRLVPAAVIHGRLTRVVGAPAAEGLVGALRFQKATWELRTTTGATLTDVPVEGEGRAVECAADGAFELRVSASGRYALASYEEGRRPTTTRVEAVVGTRVDVGTIVLEPGHALTGRALRLGDPMAGASIHIKPPKIFWAADPADVAKGMNKWIRYWRTFTSRARSVTLVWLDGRFELSGQRAIVGESGAFAFRGLAPREYRLRVVALAGSRFLPSGWDDPAMGVEGPDELVVRAPARGVVLDYNWTSIRFELEGDLGREDAGRLVLRTKSLYRGTRFTRIPDYWSKQFPLSGGEPTFVLQAPPTKRMLGEVTFPGRQTVQLDFRTPRSGGEVVVPVRLVRGEAAATLVIALKNAKAEIPDVFTVMLWRAGQDKSTPVKRLVDVAEGRLRVTGLLAEKYRVLVCPGRDPSHPGILFRNELELELSPGRVTRRSIRMQQGAGLRITLRDENGKQLGGQYELYDDSGNRVSVCLVSDRWKPGSDRWATLTSIHPHGKNRSTTPLRPGRYRLVLISPGYPKRSVKVELRAGKYEDVDVTLSK